MHTFNIIHQSADCESAPRVFRPQPGSLAAVLIAGDALNARTMTGQEYHYHHCWSWPYQVAPDHIRIPVIALYLYLVKYSFSLKYNGKSWRGLRTAHI